MSIGVANVIPGVSGGTFALIFGIYDRLTEAIGNFFTDKEKRKENFFFILIVFLGAAVGILAFAKVLGFLLDHSQVTRQITYAFFIGLIGGSIPFIVKSHSDMKIKPVRILVFAIGVVLILLTILVKGEEGSSIDHQSPLRLVWMFFCGLFSGGSMIIPGFSGSALMVSLGEYENVVSLYVGSLMDGDLSYIVPTLIFSVGAAAGIVLFAKAVEVCFRKFKSGTLYFILGLIAASLVQIFFETNKGFDFRILSLVGVGLSLICGFFLAYLTSKIKK